MPFIMKNVLMCDLAGGGGSEGFIHTQIPRPTGMCATGDLQPQAMIGQKAMCSRPHIHLNAPNAIGLWGDFFGREAKKSVTDVIRFSVWVNIT